MPFYKSEHIEIHDKPRQTKYSQLQTGIGAESDSRQGQTSNGHGHGLSERANRRLETVGEINFRL